jgi:hypothetical protein
MKTLLALAVIAGFASSAFGDIQDPPANDYGPTRKLGRGFSNFFLAAAAGYGVWRGLGRSATRHVAGFLEIVLWPFPAWRQSYYPLLPSDIPWIHAGYAEFPPELGNESKYPYVRDY